MHVKVKTWAIYSELDLEVTKSKSYFDSQIACTFQNFKSEELHCEKWSPKKDFDF